MPDLQILQILHLRYILPNPSQNKSITVRCRAGSGPSHISWILPGGSKLLNIKNLVKLKLLNFSAKPKPVKEENTQEYNKIPKESFSAAALAVLVLDHGIELMNFAKNKVSPKQESNLQKE